MIRRLFFFFNAPATPEIYPLSLHDALPICGGGGDLHATATDWATRVETNGGAAPAAATTQALSDFMDALDTASLTSLMLTVNCMVADNLIACTTPLIVGSGSDPWTNSNFTVTELDVNGLDSAGATRYLLSGIQTATHFNGSEDCGMTLYNMTATNESTRDCGCLVPSYSNVIIGHVALGGSVYWDCWSSGDRMTTANSLWTGYISFNRFGTNTQSVYRASSGTAHEVLGTRDALSTTFGTNNNEISFFGCWDGSGITFPSNKRFSFCAVHDGLTEAQSSDLYDAVQAMRTALGGGYL